jgi:hypothetical protein
VCRGPWRWKAVGSEARPRTVRATADRDNKAAASEGLPSWQLATERGR